MLEPETWLTHGRDLRFARWLANRKLSDPVGRRGTAQRLEGLSRVLHRQPHPLQILADYYQTGDTRDRNLRREYSRVTRSLAAARWSRGLRAPLLGVTAGPERTDDELAAEEVNGEFLAVINVTAWSRLRLAGLDLAVLRAAEDGGVAAVSALSARPPPRVQTRATEYQMLIKSP